MLDEISSKTVQKKRKVINRGDRSKMLNEVKPIKTINKNLQSFLETCPIKKEVLPSHKLQDHKHE